MFHNLTFRGISGRKDSADYPEHRRIFLRKSAGEQISRLPAEANAQAGRLCRLTQIRFSAKISGKKDFLPAEANAQAGRWRRTTLMNISAKISGRKNPASPDIAVIGRQKLAIR